MVIVFPGESGPDAESVAVSVAQDTFMNYAFVIMPDRWIQCMTWLSQSLLRAIQIDSVICL